MLFCSRDFNDNDDIVSYSDLTLINFCLSGERRRQNFIGSLRRVCVRSIFVVFEEKLELYIIKAVVEFEVGTVERWVLL